MTTTRRQMLLATEPGQPSPKAIHNPFNEHQPAINPLAQALDSQEITMSMQPSHLPRTPAPRSTVAALSKARALALACLLTPSLLTGTWATNALAQQPPVATQELPWADAEIRKIDAASNKLTLKHGEITNLNMPGMTMVFQVRDAKLLDDVKTGDKVQVRVIQEGRNYVVTEIRKP